MNTTIKVLAVTATLLVVGAVGWTLGALLGFWGVTPAAVIGWLTGCYVIPRILQGDRRA